MWLNAPIPHPLPSKALPLLFIYWGSNPGQEFHQVKHIPNPSVCFKEQRLRSTSFRLERGAQRGSPSLGHTLRNPISGEPCGSRTPCPQRPTATCLCLCLSPSQEAAGRLMQVACLCPAPLPLPSASSPLLLLPAPPSPAHQLSQGHLQPGWLTDAMSPAAPRFPLM